MIRSPRDVDVVIGRAARLKKKFLLIIGFNRRSVYFQRINRRSPA